MHTIARLRVIPFISQRFRLIELSRELHHGIVFFSQLNNVYNIYNNWYKSTNPHLQQIGPQVPKGNDPCHCRFFPAQAISIKPIIPYETNSICYANGSVLLMHYLPSFITGYTHMFIICNCTYQIQFSPIKQYHLVLTQSLCTKTIPTHPAPPPHEYKSFVVLTLYNFIQYIQW